MFDQSHVYWTFHWSTSATAEEQGQIGIRASTPGTPPTVTTVTNMMTAFNTFWVSSGAKVSSTFRFYRVKAALIQPDGRYDPDFDPVVVDQTSVPGGAIVDDGTIFPLQVAHSVQLTTDRDSGPAHAGRVYLPPLAVVLTSTTAKWPAAAVTARVAAFSDFLTAGNTVMGDENWLVMSQKGLGASRLVSGSRADDRPDVQRRRARQQPYTWSAIDPV